MRVTEHFRGGKKTKQDPQNNGEQCVFYTLLITSIFSVLIIININKCFLKGYRFISANIQTDSSVKKLTARQKITASEVPLE